MKPHIHHHYHRDEHGTVDKFIDWIERVEQTHQPRKTGFLDPRQAHILSELVNRSPGTECILGGGYPQAERKRALICPDYMDPGEPELGVALISVTSTDARFDQLKHGDFLGALTGLGIKRDVLGDLHQTGRRCDCIVAEEIAEYIRLHLNQVNRVQVMTDRLPLEELHRKPVEMNEVSFTASSPRLDGILSEAVRMSRANILQPIRSGKCRVNWKTEDDPAASVQEGDMISLQGFGRFRVLELGSMTKKGKIRVKIGKIV